ncbi:MAG: hypothetical protein U0Q16_24100 [Bryobacteraceae bacterium]
MEHDEASYNLADFLHEFEIRQSAEMLIEEPQLRAGVFDQGDVFDAYLAATASMLSRRIGASRPEWADRPERYLRTPWFSSPGPAMCGGPHFLDKKQAPC